MPRKGLVLKSFQWNDAAASFEQRRPVRSKDVEAAAVDALDAIAESDSSGFYRLENPAGITFVLGRWIRSRIIRRHCTRGFLAQVLIVLVEGVNGLRRSTASANDSGH